MDVKFRPLSDEAAKRIRENFPGYPEEIQQGEPGGFISSSSFVKHAKEVKSLEVREDDFWVCTFPKCGTTWMQELVWLLGNDCNFEAAKAKPLDARFPFLDMPFLPPKEMTAMILQLLGNNEDQSGKEDLYKAFEDTIAAMPSPRFIKSHLPFYLLPDQLLETAKVVYVARNPKDVLVSFYYHHKLLKLTKEGLTLEEFAEQFINSEILFTPYFEHIFDAWKRRHHTNLLFIFYEDMKADLAGQILKVAKFLGKTVTEENLAKLVEHLRIDSFAKNESVNLEQGKKLGFLDVKGNFIRKGKTGDWKNHFSLELNTRVDQWVAAHLEHSDLKFVTQLEQQD